MWQFWVWLDSMQFITGVLKILSRLSELEFIYAENTCFNPKIYLWKRSMVIGQVCSLFAVQRLFCSQEFNWKTIIIFKFSIFFFSSRRSKVVTGATDGIGREYVIQLASRGINIVLVSRYFPKLAKLASKIGKFNTFFDR